MPAMKVSNYGYLLHPIDLSVNKLLALAGRDEPRDFLDIIDIHSNILPLGALIWASVGKDPGFSPNSLLNLIRRRGKYQEKDFKPLMYKNNLDLRIIKEKWLDALDGSERFINEQDAANVGCLYYSKKFKKFICPDKIDNTIIIHKGQIKGSHPKY